MSLNREILLAQIPSNTASVMGNAVFSRTQSCVSDLPPGEGQSGNLNLMKVSLLHLLPSKEISYRTSQVDWVRSRNVDCGAIIHGTSEVHMLLRNPFRASRIV